ncbi:putative allantoinase 1 [Escovopsis weberi]|uniref:Putative allantoinase 1 n=1 Tax=Escovopsis weberi TaxID=150374 RepID=A0A0M9VVQ9_ESCWE|nr:putative allantoinase 1 [Escovopsis weberi]
MPLDGLPRINNLHTYSDLAQTEVLDVLFEPSPAIHTTLLPVIRTAVYTSYPDLIDVCQIRMLSLAASSADSKPDPLLLSVLGSHPRLGEKKISSPQSAAEQASLNGDGDEGKLAELNKEYDDKFPGLRYVAFVNGRPRQAIMREMRERIDRGDYTKEVDAAIQAICDIAKDRARKLLGEKTTGK